MKNDNLILRTWQQELLEDYKTRNKHTYLLNACPGSGKSIASGAIVAGKMKKKEIHNCIFIVPNNLIKVNVLRDYKRAGVDLVADSTLGGVTGSPLREGRGVIYTYQKLRTVTEAIEMWTRRGRKIMTIFDEVHHLSDDNTWGQFAGRIAACSTNVLAMTGTAWRTDQKKINVLDYEQNAAGLWTPVCDYTYGIRRGQQDGHIRRMYFNSMKKDGTVKYTKEWIEDGVKKTIRSEDINLTEASDTEEAAINNILFPRMCHSPEAEKLLREADDKLNEIRTKSGHENAGGIIFCQDIERAKIAAGLIEMIAGEKASLITSDSDTCDDSSLEIERFSASGTKWLVCVEMISEGVDIKRLMMAVMLLNTKSEISFRQKVLRAGRVMRKGVDKIGYVYMFAFKRMEQFASDITREQLPLVDDYVEEEVTDGRKSVSDRDLHSFSIDGSVDGGHKNIIYADGLPLPGSGLTREDLVSLLSYHEQGLSVDEILEMKNMIPGGDQAQGDGEILDKKHAKKTLGVILKKQSYVVYGNRKDYHHRQGAYIKATSCFWGNYMGVEWGGKLKMFNAFLQQASDDEISRGVDVAKKIASLMGDPSNNKHHIRGHEISQEPHTVH